MAVVNVDTGNPENFAGRKYEIMPRGIYLFEVSKVPVLHKAKTSQNMVVDVVLKCIDDAESGKYKGTSVFETIALTQKGEYRLVHLALAAGTQTREDIKNAGGVDLELLIGKVLKAEVSVEGPSTNPATGQVYGEKNRVRNYIFEEK
jgi:hypothetical protein